MDEKQIEQIIDELNEYATDYDNYEYGLPMHGDHYEKMKEIIRKIVGLK